MGVPGIRYSPSGPVIGGAGAVLRAAHNQDQLTTKTLDASLDPLDFQGALTGVASLANPLVDLNYYADGRFSLSNTDGSNATVVTVGLELSYDQVTWFLQRSQTYELAAGQFRTVEVAFPFLLGTALATPMPAGAAQIAARIVASDSDGDAAVDADELGTYFLELYELGT